MDLTNPGKGRRRASSEAGISLMEVIVGILLGLILGSVLLHFGKLGYAMYRLNSTTTAVADELEKAKAMALARNQNVGVLFDSKDRRFGVDRNSNGRLESGEAEALPEGIAISETLTVTFTRAGRLAKGSKEPEIVLTNTRNKRSVTVSSMGTVLTD